MPEPCPSCVNPSCTQYYPQSAVYQCCKPTSITLENALAEQLVPSLVSYVDNEFHGFLECLLRPGMVFLAFVAVLHMIFGALAAHNGNTAVAERMAAETDLPVKRQSSLEPEAAEEVKEDDKEEKGFSMWESISAQVKSVFPAEEAPQSISRQNSPLHVEA